ncbi:MAG: two-component system, chemotaxis family, chemotaxis protein CheY [Blastocatellia bacterium]
MTTNTDGKNGSVKGRILFLDDNEDTCELLDLVLGQAGYEIVIGHSVAEGLQLIKSKPFDMVLLDWYFTDGTGIELCRAIREADGQTPIFFYTGVAQEQYIRSAMQAGAQGCFIKPVEMDTLLQTISLQIGSREQIDPH